MTALELLTQNNLHNSHWGKRIIEAEAANGFNEDDQDDCGKWFSCACGKLDDHIARSSSGEPMDNILIELGLQFDMAINEYCDVDYDEDQFTEAAIILIDIERRSMELL
ncbi:hypothetical protein N8314_03980 [Akkermansiaceae bacterium]|nr:hypothetical protein [Akkermansiaceae bacterium]